MVESSRYFHYMMNRKLEGEPADVYEFFRAKPKILEYFYPLARKKASKYTIDEGYEEIRNGFNLQLYDTSYRSNRFVYAAQTYETNLMVNIVQHARKRIQNYLGNVHPEIESTAHRETLNHLFIFDSAHLPNPQLMRSLRTIGLEGNFHRLEAEWFRFIPLFHRIQMFNDFHGHKNFALFPQLKHGRKSIRYDSTAFFGCLKSIGLNETFKSWDDFAPQAEDYWRKYFNINKLTNFDWSFTTNGVQASITMHRIKKTAEETQVHVDHIRNRYVNNEYRTTTSCDPGQKVKMGMVELDTHNNSERNWLYRSNVYRRDVGEFKRKAKMKRIAGQVIQDKELDRSFQYTIPSAMALDFRLYCRFELKHFVIMQTTLSNKCLARLKFAKYIQTDKHLHKLCKEITKNGPTLFIVGQYEVPANSPMRGYVRTPNRRLYKYLREYCDVLQVDEFRTTMLCSTCHHRANTSQSPHRFQVCQNCKKVWNRDINGAKNIMLIGISKILNVELPPNLRRGVVVS